MTCDWKGSRTKLGNSATPEMSPQGGAHIHLASSILRGRVNSKVPRFKNIPAHYLIEKYLISLHLTFLICKRNGNISPILGEVGGNETRPHVDQAGLLHRFTPPHPTIADTFLVCTRVCISCVCKRVCVHACV